MIRALFSRKWIVATLLVISALGVMIRLGFWQLDRLAQRRTFNTHYLVQIEASALELGPTALGLDLENMEYREVDVLGQYDHPREMAIRNQSWQDQPGVRLLTPLLIAGTDTVVLVDRGWIPLTDYQTGDWTDFEEPGIVHVHGTIRRFQEPTFGGRPDPTLQSGEIARAWNFVDIEKIAPQMPHPLLAVYVQQSPGSGDEILPYANLPVIEITEGPHISYAIQWFVFTTILGIGYPILVYRELKFG
jgi:surfeit locus 1 family protein